MRALARLRTPILDVLTITGASENARCGALAVLVAEMHRRRRAFWAWTAAEWGDVLCASGRQFTGQRKHPSMPGRKGSMLPASRNGTWSLANGFSDVSTGITLRTPGGTAWVEPA